jgi:hypothetical protein
MRPFHLAFPVNNLPKTKLFYHEFLLCPMGRTNEKWLDFDFFGNQITAHLKPEECVSAKTNGVDGDQVPVRHFGAILMWNGWEELAGKVIDSPYNFLIEPKIRFKGKTGEQGTFFLEDPSGNALEFKTFKNEKMLFRNGIDDDYS